METDDERRWFAENGRRCPLSHLAHPHLLSEQYAAASVPFKCFSCGSGKWGAGFHIYCAICHVEFHHSCLKRMRKITHPYHLQHSLTLTYRNTNTGILSSGEIESYGSDGISDIIFNKCTWCGKNCKDTWFYRCLICSFCLDLSCAETLPPLTIANPKGHHHSLLFLPRPLLVPCDACGLVDALEPSYACFQCNYMAHQSCIDLPRVIKITRHPHRLSYIPYRSPVISSCRICYKEVDIKYGQYSCSLEDCTYVAHSKCATHKNVWDKEELEWITEEPTEEVIAPYRKVGDGLIEHFCHEHPLRLKKHDGVGDIEKQCRACVLLMVSSQFYHCEECDYSRHEVCADLPRKLDHALHNHSLFLDSSPVDDYKSMYCSACLRESTGFKYRCYEKYCQDTKFRLDVLCTSVPECFTHKSHEHPLFISTSCSSNDEILCKVCKKGCWTSYLQCTVCEFALCYPCGTIPKEIHYKYDTHPLTLSFGDSTEGMYWCELCEKQLDPTEWFYTCEKCCITIHLQCIFESSTFIKPGSIFKYQYGTVKVLRNNSSTRPFCYKCDTRCVGSIYYEGYKSYRKMLGRKGYTHEVFICSLYCLWLMMAWC